MEHPLAIYLQAAGKSQRQFAAEIGVREEAVSFWVNGHKTPSLANAARIEQLTDGSVPISAWLRPKEVAA